MSKKLLFSRGTVGFSEVAARLAPEKQWMRLVVSGEAEEAFQMLMPRALSLPIPQPVLV